MTKYPILYIEYNSNNITAFSAVVQEDGKVKILGSLSKENEGIEQGIILNFSNAAYRTTEVVKLISNLTKEKKYDKISITVNARSMRNDTFTVDQEIIGYVNEELIDKMKESCIQHFEDMDLFVFDIAPDAYYIDSKHEKDPLNKRGKKLRIDFNVIIGHRHIRNNIEKTIDRTGLNLDYQLVGIEALSTALLTDDEREEGVAMISFEASTTTLAIYYKGKLQEYRVVPLGSDDITSDIKSIGISYENAELLKKKVGVADKLLVTDPKTIRIPHEEANEEKVKISTLKLAHIIEARLDEIFRPIQNILDNITFPLPHGIFITGGGSKLSYLDEYIYNRTSINVYQNDHSVHLDEESESKYYEPEYALAIGALLLTNIKKETDNKVEIPGKIPFTVKVRKKIGSKINDLFRYDENPT